MIIEINVTNKRPVVIGAPVIVCGNSGYSIAFTFDSEWDAHSAKTARFVYVKAGKVKYKDVPLTGNTVAVPTLSSIREVLVGVYAGDLRTTTSAKIPCDYSILCFKGADQTTGQEMPTLQAQIGDLNQLQTVDKSNLVAAINEVKRTGGDSSQNASGLTTTEKNLILTLFRNAAYTSAGMNPAFTQLETLWNGSGEGGGDDHSHSYTSSITTAATCTTAGVRTYTCSCGHSYTESIPATGHTYVDGVCTVCGAADPTYTPGVTLSGITATYNGGEVPVGTAVNSLTGVVVTAHYSNGTSATVVGYTLSGTIAEGNNTITVTYEGQTATFVVVGANVLTGISATYSGGSVAVGTAVSELTGIVVTAHYSDGTSEAVTAYTMSGTIEEGSNTITVSYGGKTTTFTVVGVHEAIDTSPVIAQENLGIDANGQTVNNYFNTPLTGVCITKVYEYAYDNAALKASNTYDSSNDYMTTAGMQGRIQIMTPSAKNTEAGGMSSGLSNVTKTRITADGEYVTHMSNNSYSGSLFTMSIPNKQSALVNAQKVGFEFVVFKPDADDSYAYWNSNIAGTILPIGVQDGDIIFAGKNTNYYGMKNINQYTGE